MRRNKISPPESCRKCPSYSKSIFKDLSEQEMKEIDDNKIVNLYKRGQNLFVQGNPPYGFYCVCKGKIKVSYIGSDGKESILRLALSGDLLGHRGLFAEEYYTATATALEDSVVCFFDRKFINKIIHNYPSLAYNIIVKMGETLGQAEKKVTSLYQKNVQERLAELLLSLKKYYGKQADQKWMLDIKLTREEMASMIGTASETLIRFISDFKEHQIIEQQGKTLYIKDLQKLKKFANIHEDL